MEAVFDFIFSYWGLVVLLVVIITKAALDLERFMERLQILILVVEDKARDWALERGREKFIWVRESGYVYMPGWVKFVLSEKLYEKMIQRIYEEVFNFLKTEGLK